MIIQEKTLIADFLEWEKSETHHYYYVPNLYPIYPTDKCEESTGTLEYFIGNVEFDTRMDYIMPLLEKIEKQGCIVEMWMSLGKGCRICKVNTPLIKTVNFHGESNELLEAIGQAVIQYIEWYNLNNK